MVNSGRLVLMFFRSLATLIFYVYYFYFGQGRKVAFGRFLC